MKPLKLFACLVTLQFTSCLALKAADPRSFREWTDDKGRQITARLLDDTPNAESVKIERQDGRIFTVPLKAFSEADQAYVQACRAVKSSPSERGDDVAQSTSRGPAALADADANTWNLITSGGNQPGSVYVNTDLEKIISALNERFSVKGVKTNTGLPLQLRTEPADLATQIKVTGEMPSMNVAAFIKQIASINNLAVKRDTKGMVVLVDPTASAEPIAASFFGVPVNP